MDLSAEQLYKTLQARTDCKSLLKKHLTPELFDKLKDKKTKYGGSFADVIRAGAIRLPTGTGIRACDPDVYTTFSLLLDRIVQDYHKRKTLDHLKSDFGSPERLPDLDSKYVISIRTRTARCLDGYPMYPTISSKDRAAVETKTKAVFSSLEGDLKGTYYPLSSISDQDRYKLTDNVDKYLFSQNRSNGKTGSYKDWPSNRGIFFNDSKTAFVSVNEEDHLRIISMSEGGDLREVYLRFIQIMKSLERTLLFAWKDGLGYLNTSPSNFGTAIRASARVRIPKLSQQKDFHNFLSANDLEAQEAESNDNNDVSGVYDISSLRRLGLTEVEVIEAFARGIEEVIKKEKDLEK